MGQITLQNVRKSFGPVNIIKDANLKIEDGSFVVFVGPSGCGKTTLLRLIAGLEDVTGGQILIDGKNVVDVPPAKRGLSMVFQSYALYPHMSVRGNIAFGLKMAGLAKSEIDRKVEAAAGTLNLTPYLERKPRELSGGQRQRVAIGRAIVREPKAFLFDEPLSNLDAALRVQMRMEVTRLQKQLATTAIYVTHDQVEAMTMAPARPPAASSWSTASTAGCPWCVWSARTPSTTPPAPRSASRSGSNRRRSEWS